MPVSILMPQLGLTMEEGAISAWLKQPGEAVKKDEPLFSVSTDKVEMEVESPVDGTLSEILVAAGETVKVGTVLGYVEATPGAQAATEKKPAPPVAASASSQPARSVEVEAVRSLRPTSDGFLRAPSRPAHSASPRAKRLAAELGVDLSTISGTGAGGQISEIDIRQAAAGDNRGDPSQARRRKIIAERLTESIQTIPAFSLTGEANAEKLLALSQEANDARKAADMKVTITDLLLSAFAQVLGRRRELKAIWQGGGVRHLSSVDLSLAIASPHGLVAPVIRSVEALDLETLAKRRTEVVERAKNGRLSLPDLEGGLGTLSNLGMYRVDEFQAIITPGQTYVLAVGQIRERPWAEKSLTLKPTVILNLAVDHRVLDGAAAAVCLGELIELIEKPEPLLAQAGGVGEGGIRRRPNA